MEDIGDILFYLLAAVIGIAGAISSKKKKKAGIPAPRQNAPAEDYESSYSDDEEYSVPETAETEMPWQYETSEKEKTDQEVIEYREPAGKSIEDKFRMSAEYEGSYSEPMADYFEEEGVSVIEMTIPDTELGHEVKVSQEEYSRARMLIEDFDLPKAIIYSEILNRKDFV